jgi:hypothetical protein
VAFERKPAKEVIKILVASMVQIVGMTLVPPRAGSCGQTGGHDITKTGEIVLFTTVMQYQPSMAERELAVVVGGLLCVADSEGRAGRLFP